MKKAARRARFRPKNLPLKLLRIRQAFNETQAEFAKRFPTHIKQKNISSFETGEREPDLMTMVRYAELANVCVEVLILDSISLPSSIPTKPKLHLH